MARTALVKPKAKPSSKPTQWVWTPALASALGEQLDQGAHTMGLTLTDVQRAQLLDYVALLLKWNAVYNLTAVRAPADMMALHILDSLSGVRPLQSYVGQASAVRLLDVGAGAGLPGLVLAILCPDWTIELVDTVQKKAAFMQQAAGQLKLRNVKVHHARVEDMDAALPYDLIVSRAFSKISLFTDLAGHLLAPHGTMVAWKGRLDTESEQDIPQAWAVQSLVPLQVPGVAAERHLFFIQRP